MTPVLVSFVLLNFLCLLAFLLYAKKRGVLPGAALLILYVLVASVGLAFIKLAEANLLPSLFLFLGAFTIMGLGIRFVALGVNKVVSLDESLLKLAPSRFNFDRLFFERYGKGYFYVRNVLVGVVFICWGLFTLLRRTFQ